jgi:hypothetical protein
MSRRLISGQRSSFEVGSKLKAEKLKAKSSKLES